ncbi:MAG: hypothetical protein LBC97_11055 [Bifidobacteriaceae bacterium]|jgi:hypothetical protein|nr:hypothetical protein [Bifidobacteriaceae bacterium]
MNKKGQSMWFERDSWSGWREYSYERSFTSWTSDQAQGTSIFARCGSGGTYNYRAKHIIQVRDAGFDLGDGEATSYSSRHTCGIRPY